MKPLLWALPLALLPLAAPANHIREHTSDSVYHTTSGAWRVLQGTADGNNYCYAQTWNSDDEFSVGIWGGTGQPVFWVDTPGENAERFPSTVRLVIDNHYRWNFDGEYGGNRVRGRVAREAMPQFVENLSHGAYAELFTDNGRRIGFFSLKGSREAFEALRDCADMIGGFHDF